ncbi:sigma 54-interacting transcriptional regulator [Thalassoglobus sp. JC818]|uniref:sigma 54-interacting transcriptional regulator n=1 Tax=Thalassoglobus sp. JC818 TaxID=3232136 RepID=UPI00345789C3
MDDVEVTRVDHIPAQPGYLAVYRGDALLEAVELPQTGRLTIGRAQSNRIVIPDSKCSREHCELYLRGGTWFLRDLESRNGVTVDGERVVSDSPISFGQSIQIGGCELRFSRNHPDEEEAKRSKSPSDTDSSYEIIERTSGAQLDRPFVERINARGDGTTAMFRIAREIASASSVGQLCQVVVDGLMRFTKSGIGGVLLPEDGIQTSDASNFVPKFVAGNSTKPTFSSYLSQIVLSDGDAVLAHNISTHSVLGVQESLQQLHAESAICAPIRHDGHLLGLLHLYCVTTEHALTQTDLEFVLAVADQMGDQLNSLLEKQELATGIEKARQQVSELHHQLRAETELVGHGPKLEELRRSISRVAPTDALVLIRGESGVGKELVARAVHFNSRRREEPFVCVNCAALTESLLESELFGHEKGAFTGASTRRAGKFEQADKGTLFLDEIGEMSPEIQAKFLRILEGQAFERVGGGESIHVDVRVVTATNRDLEEAVREGTFRTDLFFRLQVIEIHVPSLREHIEDLPAIAQHFVDRFSAESNYKGRRFGSAAIRKLQSHSWPGNVRELRNVVERAVILSENEVLEPDDVVLTNLRLSENQQATEAKTQANEPVNEALETSVDPLVDLFGSFVQQETSLDEIDRYYIQAVLNATDWNKSKASRILQIERTTLDRRLKKYEISRPDGDDDEEE